jgi:CubicO group peptidase (beta-lactamase class C family)
MARDYSAFGQQSFSAFVRLIGIGLVSSIALASGTDNVDDYVNTQLRRQRIAGLSLAVIQDGQLIKAKGYGSSNLETAAPATAETVYKIGSVSKSFLAAAAMLLVEDGKLHLDDPIAQYMQDVPESWKGITIRHLLTHTSGIVEDPPGFTPFRQQPDTEVIHNVYPVPLLFAPGEKWSYSNAGYFVLGAILSKASGVPWPRFVNDRVFQPLHMNATRTTTTAEIVPHRATGYVWVRGEYRKAEDWVAVRPSGAFLSTVLDLARWDTAVRSRSLLKASSWEQILSPVRLKSQQTHPYGLGFFLDPWQGRQRIYHDGQLPGFLTVYEYFPADRLSVIAMTNTDEVGLGKLVHSIAGFYVSQLAPPAYHSIPDTEPKVTATVKRMISGFVNDDLPDMNLFTARLASDLTPGARTRLGTVLSKFGSIQSVVLVERTSQGHGGTYRYRVGYPDGSIFVICSLDSNGLIQGIWYEPDTGLD